MFPVEELIRFVLSPEGVVTPDLRRKLPGRGVWLQARRSVLEAAIRKNAFARSLRQPARMPEELTQLVEKLLRKEALGALSLANKAGLVITGYEKIKVAIEKDRVKWLLHATDAADNGSDKLDRLFMLHTAQPDNEAAASSAVLPSLFTAGELSLALGRENVVHVGLKQGEAAKRFRTALLKAFAFGETEPKAETAAPESSGDTGSREI